MSFTLPTTITIVDKYKYPLADFKEPQIQPTTILDVINKYQQFKEIVKIAGFEGILNDPQANLTLFVPMDFMVPTESLINCNGGIQVSKQILNLTFETARKIVNSLTTPSVITTTMMMQSGITRYKTRDFINTLTTTSEYCVQFEPEIYNRPPFGIVINNRSKILVPDTVVSNGVVHTIDVFPYK